MTKSRNRYNVKLTVKNVANSITFAINSKEISLPEWEEIKCLIDKEVLPPKEIIEPFAANKFIKWLLGY
jgi:hypothetical protein